MTLSNKTLISVVEKFGTPLYAEQRDMPEIREGDLLAIKNAGAYCYSMGGVYNLRSMLAEAIVYQGEWKLVRKGLRNEELVSQILNESIPGEYR
uniref:Pyridoxal-dependent decarboxylase, C-terminal sheet domain n=2 Tax=Candidatus Kentrum sp. SD TaxID=2126332 RepID=A0A451BQF8_9GAMM|nr:MAG: Pyridoxal-dependent decarboxylase, C-terminal sheet domain [Candidatus Kentron sp. SD]